jgi:hypothetical protein
MRTQAKPRKFDWDILPTPKKGDSTQAQLYAAVGDALTQWERLEEKLADIFSVLVGAPEVAPGRGPAISAYGSVNNFSVRATLLKAAAEAFFAQYPADVAAPIKKGFDDLMLNCNQFVARRNDIAHGKREWVAGRGHCLLPAFYNRKKHRPGQAMAFCYSSREIRTYANHFIDLQSLADRINLFPGRPAHATTVSSTPL